MKFTQVHVMPAVQLHNGWITPRLFALTDDGRLFENRLVDKHGKPMEWNGWKEIAHPDDSRSPS